MILTDRDPARSLRQRPEQPATSARKAEEFQRVAIEPRVIRQLEIVAGPLVARRRMLNQDLSQRLKRSCTPRRAPAGSLRAYADRRLTVSRRGARLRDGPWPRLRDWHPTKRRITGLRAPRRGERCGDRAGLCRGCRPVMTANFSLELTRHALPLCPAATALFLVDHRCWSRVPISGTEILDHIAGHQPAPASRSSDRA